MSTPDTDLPGHDTAATRADLLERVRWALCAQGIVWCRAHVFAPFGLGGRKRLRHLPDGDLRQILALAATGS